jgi:DNA-binding MarR family transcriptional regulator
MHSDADLFMQQLFCLKGMVGGQDRSMEERVATGLQYGLFQLLRRQERSSVGEVASRLSLSASSATQLVERMVKAGFVQRQPDTEDRRVVYLTITPEGEAEHHRMQAHITEKVEHALSALTTEERKELLRLHSKLCDALTLSK